MTDALIPSDENELAAAIADAAAARTPLEIAGGGTRRPLGRPVQAAKTLSTRGLSGISLYEPGALTIIAKAGTSLAEVEAALAAEGQRLAFEPMDHRTILRTSGEPTIGAVVACNVSGPRRIQAGACRDSLIGVRFVDGSGNVLKNGGRVMKNVTGYDLVKLMCGSWGTLGVLTEVAFKVLPAAEREATLVLEGLDAAEAVSAMSRAMGAPYDVTGAAHLPGGDLSSTLLRVEGLAGQVDYRLSRLGALFPDIAQRVAEGAEHDTFWRRLRNVEPFADDDRPIWRLSVKPGDAPSVVEVIEAELGGEVALDWAGGLIWTRLPENATAHADVLRTALAKFGGHATLVRAPETVRAAVDVFHPQPVPIARLSADLRAKFDPAGILNPGRMVA